MLIASDGWIVRVVPPSSETAEYVHEVERFPAVKFGVQIKSLDSVHGHILCTPIFESVILLSTRCGAAVLQLVEVLG